MRLKAVAFAGRQCECAGAARPAAAEQPSRMKIEPNMRNCLRIDYAEIHNYAEITQSLHSHYAKITQTLRIHYAFITQLLRNSITQHHDSDNYAATIHYAITYAIPLRN